MNSNKHFDLVETWPEAGLLKLFFKVRGRDHLCYEMARCHTATAIRICEPGFPNNNWNGFRSESSKYIGTM